MFVSPDGVYEYTSSIFAVRFKQIFTYTNMKTIETLSEAITDLRKRGYEHDFNLRSEWLECQKLNLQLKPVDFHVDEVHRFEGMTNPDDSSILFAIQSPHGIKGILVDAYGTYAESISNEMLKRLSIDGKTSYSN